MKILKHILFFAILFSFGCKKERNLNPIPAPFFLDSSPTIGESLFDFGDCDNPPSRSNVEFCEIVQQEQLLLTDVTKSWVPQYQFDVGTQFKYKNQAGQTLELTLTAKEHLLVERIQNRERCEENSDEFRGLCHETEIFYILLENEDKGIKLYVEMGMSFQTFAFSDPTFVQGRLLFAKLTPEGNKDGRFLWDEEFDESSSLFMITDFEEESVLLNRTFQKVLSKDLYFYNKQFGLVGFIDDFNELWVLDE